ncbi:tetratricopeptide repeat protein, partial [Kitasatospora sp. NPDC004272]
MERDRVVVVEGPDGPGSGYAIAARLVLTSAHAVPAPGGRVPVFRPGRAAEHPARVLWRGTPGGRDDAALLLVEDPAWTPPASGTPLRWGRLATTRPGTPCETWGAPDLVQHPGRPTDQLHPSGTLNPGDRDIGNRYAMNLDGHPPEPAAPGRSPWGGLSGAALFCGDLLTGVIAADPARRAHAVLEAVPAYVLLRDPGFRAALAAHGAGAGTVLEAVEWQHLDDPADRTAPFRSPAVLLHARRQTVPFRGREDLLAPLLDWTGRPGFGAHLLHGPGGQGKTRLAQHLADAAAERTQVLWLDAGAPPGELAVLAGTTRPLLVVVDYAETRAPQLLALLDAAHRHRGPHPFKLLLLARTAGDWWDNLQSATSRAADLLDGAPTTPLGPLEPEPGRSRTQAYREALDGYARHLPDVDDWQHHDWPALAARLRDREVDATALGTALTLHMTALADLLDAATGTTAGDTAPGAAKVEDRLLHHERRYWTAAAETCGLLPALSEATLADALTAAFLLGARDRAEGDAVLHRVPALADQTRDRRTLVSDWITSLYPPPGNDHRWGLLQPDRLAERFIGRHLTRHPELAHHLAPAVTRPQADHLLTLTTRATTHPGLHHLAPHLTTLIATHPATLAPAAIDAATQAERPGPLLDALQRIVDDPATPVSLLEELAAEIPSASHVLDPWAAQLFERLVTIHRGQPRHDPDRRSRLGRSLNRLAIRLGDLGRWEEALAVAEEAVLVHRGLVAVRPDEYLPQFGKVLNTLAIRLGDLGRWEEALAVAEEAILVHRGLVAVRPDEYLPQFGKVLNTLAIRLGDL